MAVEWSSRGDGAPVSGLDSVLRDGPARRLLLIVLVDATPVAVTATLFLVHMADHLGAPGGGGQVPLLLLILLSAAIAAPHRGRATARGSGRAERGGGALDALALPCWGAAGPEGSGAAFVCKEG